MNARTIIHIIKKLLDARNYVHFKNLYVLLFFLIIKFILGQLFVYKNNI